MLTLPQAVHSGTLASLYSAGKLTRQTHRSELSDLVQCHKFTPTLRARACGAGLGLSSTVQYHIRDPLALVQRFRRCGRAMYTRVATTLHYLEWTSEPFHGFVQASHRHAYRVTHRSANTIWYRYQDKHRGHLQQSRQKALAIKMALLAHRALLGRKAFGQIRTEPKGKRKYEK